MWCGKCQADVGAEVSPDNQRVFCTICGSLLSTIDLPPTRPISDRLGDRTKDARELLQRWSSSQVLDPFGPLPKSPTLPRAVETTDAQVSGAASAPRFSVTSRELRGADADAAPLANSTTTKESVAEIPPPVSATVVAEVPAPTTPRVADVVRELLSERALLPITTPVTTPLAVAAEPSQAVVAPPLNPLVAPPDVPNSSPVSLPSPFVTAAAPSNVQRVDAAHPADHFASAKPVVSPFELSTGPFVSKPAVPESSRDSRRPVFWFPTWDPAVWRSESNGHASWSSMAGQVLAYAGVLGLTAGACMVVWSYFGGPAHYAPMGWLLATAGQMLLFFGVVTLVSGGLEQTTEQVNKRIEQLGDHIIRIEQAARDVSLRGQIPPGHFGEDRDVSVPQRSERAQ
ncbi:MAG: hypothetical protein ACKV2Q_17780 [Planctomycetaceae bacterium]